MKELKQSSDNHDIIAINIEQVVINGEYNIMYLLYFIIATVTEIPDNQYLV